MQTPRCPNCQGASVVFGDAPGYSGGHIFLPRYYRYAIVPPGVGLRQPVSACLSCGHFWSTLDPEELRGFLRSHGGEIGRQQVDELDHGPCRDLPDTELGRAIGSKISELDALARTGSSVLVRRCRDMLGVTWDEAIRITTRWSQLTREEKLELFGWVPKDARKDKAFDDFDSPFA